MRWGVRKAEGSGGGPQAVQVKSHFGNRLVRTSGGKGHALSEDATKAATARQKAKKSNVRSLSNKELQDLVTRMNLEAQYSQLEKKRVDAGRKKVGDILAAGKEAFDIYKNLSK